MEYEKEYLEMMRDTSNLVAKEKAMQLVYCIIHK